MATKRSPKRRFRQPLHLTPREEQILAHLTDGITNREIALKISASKDSVKMHLSNLYEKIGCRNRVEATLFLQKRKHAAELKDLHGYVQRLEAAALPTGKLTFAEAISRQEGFYVAGSRAARNHNPGNLAWDGPHGFAAAHGATHGDNGEHTNMAVFLDDEAGFTARRCLLSAPAVFLDASRTDRLYVQGSRPNLLHGYLGATIEQVIYRYCPPTAPGNSRSATEAYVENVRTWMECIRLTKLTLALL